MNCQEARELIEDALDKRLTGCVKRKFDLHLTHCRDCRRFYEAEQAEHARWFRAMNDTAAEPPHPLPPDFADRLVAAVLAKDAAQTPFFRRFRIPRWAKIAASLLALASFVSFAAVVIVEKVVEDDDFSALQGTEAPEGAEAAEGTKGTEETVAAVATFSEDSPAVPVAPSVSSDPSIPSSGNQLNPNQGEQEMNIKKKAVTALAAATLAAAPASATELPWTGGDATLGDGKVVILCDGSGSVTNIVAKPTGGEELRITGSAMTFAAGAIIEFAAPSDGAVANGSLVFANDVTTAGALNMTRTDDGFLAWTGNNTILKGTSNYDVNALPGKASVIDNYMFYSAFADPPSGAPVAFPRGTYQLTDAAPQNGAYAMNLWKNGYTWSLRLQVAKAGNVDVHLRLATIVRQPFGVYEPTTDVWDTYFYYPNGLLDDAWWWFINEKSGNTRHIKGGVYKGQAGNGSTGYSGVKHVVWRHKNASVVTVGFAGDVTINSGTVDVALGVKMAVLPKANSTFAAPVFSGMGDVEYQRNATLAKANYLEYSSYLTVTNGAVVTVTANNSIPTNAIVNVYANSTLSINTTANGLAGGYPELCIHPDGTMFVEKTSTQHTFANGQRIIVDGGTVWVGHDKAYAAGGTWKDSRCYLWQMTLMNGAQIKGPYANVGNNQPTQWMIVGENQSPVTVDAIGALGWTGQVFKFFVADITDSDAADCVVGGEMPAFESGSHVNYRHYTIQKDGAGTMQINGQWALRGTTTVNEGGIVFGDNGGPFPVGAITQLRTSEDGSRSFVLKNGAKLGKTAGALELDALTVTDGGVLELGPTATMSFADSSAKTWSGTLIVKGYRDNAIRFGDSKDALTATQQASIKTVDGKKLHLTCNGYLAPRGMMIVIR